MVQIKLEKIRPITKQTQLLVLGLFEGESELLFKTLGNDLSAVLKEVVENGEFTGTFGSNYLLPTFGKIGPKRIMLTGLGKKEKYSKEYARIAGFPGNRDTGKNKSPDVETSGLIG